MKRKMKHVVVILLCVLVMAAATGLSAGKTGETMGDKEMVPGKHEPIVEKLITILKARPALKTALLHSLEVANRLDAPTLEEYYKWLDKTVTLIPTDRNLYYAIVEFYYLIDHDEQLQKDPLFQQWMIEFANDWGSFLDTPRSAAGIKTFLTNPDFHMEDYMEGPGGWHSFNEFFAREVKPGKRPIACLYDDKVIVSPADCAFVGCWEITPKSEIIIKDKNEKPYSIEELLDNRGTLTQWATSMMVSRSRGMDRMSLREPMPMHSS